MPRSASTDLSRCCNSCDDIRAAYRERRWGFPDPSTFEQCRREARRRTGVLQEGEGCNIYGTMQVARASSAPPADTCHAPPSPNMAGGARLIGTFALALALALTRTPTLILTGCRWRAPHRHHRLTRVTHLLSLP